MLLLATEAEVWSIVAAVAGAVSAIAAMIACILTYRTTRPRLVFKTNKILFVEGLGKRFAFADITIVNKSSVKGAIAEISLCKGKIECDGEYSRQHYELTGINIEAFTNGIPAESNRLTLPITVDPFAVVSGFILFPCLPDNIVVGDRVSLRISKTNDIHPVRAFISFIAKLTKRREYEIKQSQYTFKYEGTDRPQDKAASGNDIDNRAN